MIKITSLSKTNIIYLAKFLLLLALATCAPLIGVHSQWVTGPIVNMALILSVFLVDARGALLIGMLPSTIALGTGLLPAVLAPMIPFIIISNAILILVMDFFVCHSERSPDESQDEVKNPLTKVDDTDKGSFPFGSLRSLRVRMTKNYWPGLFAGAGLKYLFLFFTSNIVINLLLNKNVAIKVAQMMSWPQFFTAIIGGVLAWGVLKILRKK